LTVKRRHEPDLEKEALRDGKFVVKTNTQLPAAEVVLSMFRNSLGKGDPGAWLAGQGQMLGIMDFFPQGWGSLALTRGISGDYLSGLGWSLLLLVLGVCLFILAFDSIKARDL